MEEELSIIRAKLGIRKGWNVGQQESNEEGWKVGLAAGVGVALYFIGRSHGRGALISKLTRDVRKQLAPWRPSDAPLSGTGVVYRIDAPPEIRLPFSLEDESLITGIYARPKFIGTQENSTPLLDTELPRSSSPSSTENPYESRILSSRSNKIEMTPMLGLDDLRGNKTPKSSNRWPSIRQSLFSVPFKSTKYTSSSTQAPTPLQIDQVDLPASIPVTENLKSLTELSKESILSDPKSLTPNH